MYNLIPGAQLAIIKTIRAAVVPYTVKKDANGLPRIFFMFAIDKKTGDITDFGGGVKKYESSLVAGLREFREESNEIFDDLYDINDMYLSFALVGKKRSALFIPVHEKWFDIAPRIFENKKRLTSKKNRKSSHDEVSKVFWMGEDSFMNIISGKDKSMWAVIKNFYRNGYTPDVGNVLSAAYFLKMTL